MIPYAAIVLVLTPEGIPLVREPNKPAPIFWKLPGGASNFGETAEQCALRELEEETGLRIGEGGLFKEISRKDLGTHVKVFFKVWVPSLDGLKQHGDEGEEVKVFSRAAASERASRGTSERARWASEAG
mgnify:CR=1 FL=1